MGFFLSSTRTYRSYDASAPAVSMSNLRDQSMCTLSGTRVPEFMYAAPEGSYAEEKV